MVVLDRPFYARETLKVAQDLLGDYLVYNDGTTTKIGMINETEAYLGLNDKASHSSKGVTPRTQVLFGPAGIIYVYLIYGMYHCLNVVTDTPESGGAVLIRSLVPVENIDGRTDGPGRLCKSLGITRELNGLPIFNGPLTIQRVKDKPPVRFETLPRIGIDYAGEDKDHLYRFRIVEPA